MRLHHLGIVTKDAPTLAESYATLFGARVVHEEEFDGLDIAFLDVGNCYFELLEPLDDEGTVARFLNREGPGLHHLALAVSDLNESLTRVQESGVELVDDEPRPGAWGHEVAFLHPRSTGGVLIEFVEE